MPTSPLLRSILLGLGCSLTLVACGDDTTGAGGSGGSSSSGEGGATSSTTSDGGSTTTGDGGSTGAGDGGGGGAAIDPSTLPDSGRVGFYQFGGDAEVSASFQRERPWDLEYAGGCEEDVVIGPCFARRCMGETSPVDIDHLDAGAMTASGLVQAVTPVVDEGGAYEWRGTGPLFEPGAELSASFTGGDVPAFSATIVAPPRLSAFEPALDEGIVLTEGQDVDVTWTVDGTGGEVVVQLLGFDDELFEAVVCTFDSADLAGTVPSELFPTLPGIAYVSTQNVAHQAVGSHDVTVIALDLAVLEGSYEVGP